jgi:hypothetical protein
MPPTSSHRPSRQVTASDHDGALCQPLGRSCLGWTSQIEPVSPPAYHTPRGHHRYPSQATGTSTDDKPSPARPALSLTVERAGLHEEVDEEPERPHRHRRTAVQATHLSITIIDKQSDKGGSLLAPVEWLARSPTFDASYLQTEAPRTSGYHWAGPPRTHHHVIGRGAGGEGLDVPHIGLEVLDVVLRHALVARRRHVITTPDRLACKPKHHKNSTSLKLNPREHHPIP